VEGQKDDGLVGGVGLVSEKEVEMNIDLFIGGTSTL